MFFFVITKDVPWYKSLVLPVSHERFILPCYLVAKTFFRRGGVCNCTQCYFFAARWWSPRESLLPWYLEITHVRDTDWQQHLVEILVKQRSSYHSCRMFTHSLWIAEQWLSFVVQRNGRRRWFFFFFFFLTEAKLWPAFGNGTDVGNGSWGYITKGLGFDYNYNVSFTPQKLPAVLLSYKQKDLNVCMVLSSVVGTFARTRVYKYLCFTLRQRELLGIRYTGPFLAHALTRYEPRVTGGLWARSGQGLTTPLTAYVTHFSLSTVNSRADQHLSAVGEPWSLFYLAVAQNARPIMPILPPYPDHGVSRDCLILYRSLFAMNMTTRKLQFCV